MYLTHQDVKVVNEFLRCPSIKINRLAEKLSLTRNQLVYSIQKINTLSIAGEIINIDKGMASISNQNYYLLNQFIETNSNYEYVLTEHERVYLILSVLVCSGQKGVFFQDLLVTLKVSKNTLSNDLKLVSDELKVYHLVLGYSRVSGYSIQGDEMMVRRAIFNIANGIKTILNINESINSFSEINIFDIQRKTRFLEHKLSLHFSDDAYDILTLSLLFNIARIKNGFVLKEGFESNVPEEFEDISSIFFDSKIDTSDSKWLSTLVASSSLMKKDIDTSNLILRNVIIGFIEDFEKNAYLSLGRCDDFIARLERHIQPAMYRAYLGSSGTDMVADEVIHQYTYLKMIVKKSIHILEKYMGITMPDVEISYLTMYIGSELINVGYNLNPSHNVLIVCSSGIATSHMLEAQIRNLFPHLNIIGTISSRQINSITESYSAVFSTVPIQTDKFLYLVNPLMSEDEKNSIIERVYTDLHYEKASNSALDSLIEIAKKNCVNFDDKSFKKEVLSMFQVHHQGLELRSLVKIDQKNIADFLKSEFILKVPSVSNYKELISKAYTPLVDSNYIDKEHFNSILKLNLNDYPHFFLNGGLFIPHLDLSNTVNEDCFGMMILDDPLTIDDDRFIKTIIPICIRNNGTHFKAIQQLFELLENDEFLELIRKSKIEEIKEFINNIN